MILTSVYIIKGVLYLPTYFITCGALCHNLHLRNGADFNNVKLIDTLSASYILLALKGD